MGMDVIYDIFSNEINEYLMDDVSVHHLPGSSTFLNKHFKDKCKSIEMITTNIINKCANEWISNEVDKLQKSEKSLSHFVRFYDALGHIDQYIMTDLPYIDALLFLSDKSSHIFIDSLLQAIFIQFRHKNLKYNIFQLYWKLEDISTAYHHNKCTNKYLITIHQNIMFNYWIKSYTDLYQKFNFNLSIQIDNVYIMKQYYKTYSPKNIYAAIINHLKGNTPLLYFDINKLIFIQMMYSARLLQNEYAKLISILNALDLIGGSIVRLFDVNYMKGSLNTETVIQKLQTMYISTRMIKQNIKEKLNANNCMKSVGMFFNKLFGVYPKKYYKSDSFWIYKSVIRTLELNISALIIELDKILFKKQVIRSILIDIDDTCKVIKGCSHSNYFCIELNEICEHFWTTIVIYVRYNELFRYDFDFF